MPKLTKNPTLIKSISVATQTVPSLCTATQNLHQLVNAESHQFSQRIGEIKQVLSKIQTVPAQQFSKLFSKLLAIASYQNIKQIGELLSALVCHNYDEDEVITMMKKCKQVDPVLVLALTWKYYTLGKNTQQQLVGVLKIINLMLICYPVDLMLHGNDVLAKWHQILSKQVELINQTRKVMNLINTMKCQGGDKYGYNTNTFYDIHIPL